MLNVEHLVSGYGESIVLRSVNLEVPAGKVVCLMGRNGTGKTTFVKTLMGIIRAQEGRIRFEGKDLTRSAPGARARQGIGYVPQGREIFAQLSVRDNLLLGLEAARDGRRDVPEEAVARFPALKEMMNRRGGDLSGGQQQQLAFARALAASPKLLVLDEPTEGIQPSIVSDIQDVIRELKAAGTMAILLVEQSFEFAKSVADYFCIMEKGVIVASGTVDELDEEAAGRHLAV
ncbi:MAG: urea ABC transporter ATP-binding subunit UrtE [Cohnella sp.]|uniref:urea ABC transporter ATP-binding subunit UrtE n=1 Tax=Cohnella sp. TaxID=1883426 RepID=UPI000E392B0D|nr:urea ABC transporter ATP-binding subunit UrtE [Cohnella sp.]REK68656.1 MAG: urea ABC transporter ATP-binding subunit UrtE [Cohnella sp.]